MSLLLSQDFGTLILNTNFATPFIHAIATALSNGLQLSSSPDISIGCLQLIGSNGRTGNVIDGQTQVNFVLLNTNAFIVSNAVAYLESATGSQSLNSALAAANLPALILGSIQTVSVSSSSSSSGLDSGAIAGIVIGGTVALFILICAMIYVCCYRSSLTKSKNTAPDEVDQSRADKHSNLDDNVEEEQTTDVEMQTMPEEVGTA